MLQAAVCIPVVLWLFLVQPISLRTMHDDDSHKDGKHTGDSTVLAVTASEGLPQPAERLCQ